jgi:hypothetical protein
MTAVVPERTARWQLALSGLMIAAGGLLLGMQVDGAGDVVGTGYTALGIGALVALVATLVQASTAGKVPRDPVAGFSAAVGFCGLSFLVAGVLAPGGTWMFFEVFLLFWLLARRRDRFATGGPEIGGGILLLVTLMLLFRLWITWQGSQHRWALMSVDVPLLSSISIDWLEPVKRVSLGSFSPTELGFPPTGLDFPLSMTLWAAGFALCASGLWMRGSAAREHENDRINSLIQTLPPASASLVVRVVPEEEWQSLGLHGLSKRRLASRLEALVAERLRSYRDVQNALDVSPIPDPGPGDDFPHIVGRAFADRSLPSATPSALPAPTEVERLVEPEPPSDS